MISVDEALGRVLSLVPVLSAERRPLLETLGQVLAEDASAKDDVPPHANSAMDGYAVRWEDTRAADADRPVTLRVIGNLAAGEAPSSFVAKGTALRIMTGAVLPPGASAVVQFEDTDEGKSIGGGPGAPQAVRVYRPATEWLNVRHAGEDVARGAVVLRRGNVIRPPQLGVLAALGYREIAVIRRPRVAVLSTGDELVDVDQGLAPGKIRDSNRYALAAQVLDAGAVPIDLGITRDIAADLVAKIREAEGKGADLLITSAGVSVGDYDFTKQVLAAEGEIAFWQVCMRPGRPLAFGRIGRLPHLGLPGNPVAAMLSFELFGRRAVRKMMGKHGQRPEIEAILRDGRVVNRDGRRSFYRVAVSRQGNAWHARLTGPQGSGILTSMAMANGLMVIPEERSGAEDGERVRVMMIDWLEED